MAEKYFGFRDNKVVESESHRDENSCVRSIVEVFSVTLTVTVRRVDLEKNHTDARSKNIFSNSKYQN